MTFTKRLIWLALLLSIASISAKADSAPVNVYVDGSYAFANNGFGIGPYGGTLNGQAASFYCVDFSHDIVGQTGWLATVTPLGQNGTTLLQNPTTYDEMAWLILK